MQLLKPFDELKIEEKVMIIHTLFPWQIESFLSFTDEHLTKLLSDPAMLFESWSNAETALKASKWEELLKEIKSFISSTRTDLIKDAAVFTETFTRGYMLTAFIQCLNEYITDCENEDFVKGAVFLFDL